MLLNILKSKIHRVQVTEVGAEYAASAATTTDTYSPNNAPNGPRREKINGPDTKPADEFPVGEPWIMAALAVGFAGVIYVRRKKTRMSE